MNFVAAKSGVAEPPSIPGTLQGGIGHVKVWLTRVRSARVRSSHSWAVRLYAHA